MRKDVNDMFEIKGKVTTAICYAISTDIRWSFIVMR